MNRSPKIKTLTENETFSSFQNWQQSLLFSFAFDSQFAEFLVDGATWLKTTTANPTRGLADDTEGANKRTKEQKALSLEIMLGQIASYCPVSRTSIVRNSTSLSDVWQQIRQYYGFQTTGSQFLNLGDIKQEDGERPETLYQRLYCFFEDNLLSKASGITHCGETPTTDEQMSPTLENTIVWMWLRLLHPGLPSHVSLRYGPVLRDKTLMSIRNEISAALPTLLNELETSENAKVFYNRTGQFQKRDSHRPSSSRKGISKSWSNEKDEKVCPICKAYKRPFYHYLSRCHFLSEGDKRMFSKARLVSEFMNDEDNRELDDDDSHFQEHSTDEPFLPPADTPHIARRVTSEASGVLPCKYGSESVSITVDSGATSNMIQARFVKRLGIKIHKTHQCAFQADGKTPLNVLGEVHTMFTRNQWSFAFDGLVVSDLDVDVLGGTPFMSINDIAIRPYNCTIIIKWKETVKYTATQVPLYSDSNVRRTQSFVLRGPDKSCVILPGESLALPVPHCSESVVDWAVEPRSDSKCTWVKPSIITSEAGLISITNVHDEPVLIPKHAHVCQVTSVINIEDIPENSYSHESRPDKSQASCKPFSSAIAIDPDNIVSNDIKQRAFKLHSIYDEVFNPAVHKYNGFSGNIEGRVNMGPVLPPQRKAQSPHYNHEKLVQLQDQFDTLEESGVFCKPEALGIVAEYINMSFLVPKSNGEGSRLVTSFGPVAMFTKPQPSIMPSVDNTVRLIGQWKYLIKSDLSKAFYQIPLSQESMKYCGVATPFRGVRVYARCAMGMPGSETALEELMNRTLGHLVQAGCVAKIADDLYCGGDTPEDALVAWEGILKSLADNGLGLSATKTVIFPKSTVVLGWIWCDGTLQASPHRLSALAAVDPPKTVKALRSFIGAYKVLSKVIQGYSDLIHPFDRIVAGRQSTEKIEWNDNMLHKFKKVQESLQDCKIITIPRSSDQLYIVGDGSQQFGIASTLWILRDTKLLLGGFFNSQLKQGQTIWLPCEVEALCIGASAHHFAAYIIQSETRTHFLTDNKPCVQAYKKMCRGFFSNSARIVTFLNAAGRYHVTVSHISGVRIPLADYNSRNPVQCESSSCQVCKFVADTSDAVVRKTTVESILKGDTPMPFASRSAWLATQQECSSLRRVYAQLSQGTRPSKKMTKIPHIKKYLNVAVIARDGLLVVRENVPFQGTIERIVVPQGVIHGLVTVTHIRLEHPTAHQSKRVLSRYFYAIALDKVIDQVTSACDTCSSLESIPAHLVEQSTTEAPSHIGTSFAADVMKRNKQLVLVVRETVSSYTVTMFVSGEGKEPLREALLVLCLPIKTSHGKVRIDSGPGIAALVNDPVLLENGLVVEVGRVKNVNKNPVAEKAIEELGNEILRLNPSGGPMSDISLAKATALLNSRVRRDGLSSREIWTQRDQVTGAQLPFQDSQIIDSQQASRRQNHKYSEKSKSHGKGPRQSDNIQVGSLVYIINEGDKTQAREKYIVISTDNGWCKVRKFTDNQFRAKIYDLKMSEVFLVPDQVQPLSVSFQDCSVDSASDSDSSYDEEDTTSQMGNDVNTPGSRYPSRIRRPPNFYDNPVSNY